ncbi:MAG: hypothetical protein Q8R92_01595 [Deltaproteobacteria bacterium]|nr:hypothetical protein [Deltaproteobacteria bacterium]
MNERLPRSLLLSGLVSLVIYAGYNQWPELIATLTGRHPSVFSSTSVLWWLLWCTYLPAVLWVARTPPTNAAGDRRALLFVLLLAVLFRLVLLPGDPDLSSDYHRYLWDGRVFSGGVNPYALAPNAPALAPFRYDALHMQLNRPDVIGVYPPLSQWVFAVLASLRPDALGLKLTFLVFEALGVFALLALLRREGRPLAQSAVYLWNPLIVIEITRGGHSDPLMLPFFLLALVFRLEGRRGAAGIALGLATLARIYPMVILPALMQRAGPGRRGIAGFDPRLPLAFLATLVVGYAPFVVMDGGLWGHLPIRLGADYEEFNAGVRTALRYLLAWVAGFDDPWRFAKSAGRILLAGYLIFTVRVLFKGETAGSVSRRAMALLGGWLLFVMPAVEPWYAWGLVALSAVTLSPAWIWFSGAAGFSYLKFAAPSGLVPAWVLLMEYFPTLALLARSAGGSTGVPPAEEPEKDEAWPRPLPPGDQTWTRVPFYIVGVLPILAALLVLYFFFVGFVGH